MNIKRLIEVLLFSSSEPLSQKRINQIMEAECKVDLKAIVDELNNEYREINKGLIIKNISGGYQILSSPEYHIYIDRLFKKSRKVKLSKPALEALSIIAYKQPVSKSEIESIRGVECGSVLNTLMERELVTIKGRSKVIGRALLFGTTQYFLEIFGLERIDDLPKLKELTEIAEYQNNPDLFKNNNAIK